MLARSAVEMNREAGNSAVETADALRTLANVLVSQKRLEDAEAAYRECIEIRSREDPRSPVPQFHLGEVLWQLGLADDAVRAWEASAGLDKKFSPPRLALAEVALTRGDFTAAADNAALRYLSSRPRERSRSATTSS